MATGNMQTALITCSKHDNMKIQMYCRTCRKSVCTNCVKEEHKDDDWDTIANIADVLRQTTGQEKLTVESVSKSIMAGIEEILENNTSEADIVLKMNCFQIEEKKKRTEEVVAESLNEMKSICKKSHESKLKSIEEQRKLLRSKGERIQFLIQNLETGASDYTDFDLIELHDGIHQILNELQGLSALAQGSREMMVFRPGTFDMALLKSLVGTAELKKSAYEAELEKEFVAADIALNCIRLVSGNDAWTHPTQTTFNHLVDISGTIKQTVNLECLVYNFTVSEDGSMYFCDSAEKTVKQLDNQCNINTLFSTFPLIPSYINLTRSGDLLITLIEKEKYERDSSSRRLLRRTSMSGEVMKEYEYDNDGKTPLFGLPAKPIEHANGNIYVISEYENATYTYQGTVYGLHCRNNVILKYNGTDDKFVPTDICFDNDRNILIADWFKRVHIINLEGQFIAYLLTDELFHEKIDAMGLFNNKLWIGSEETGSIKVFKLKKV